MKRFLENASERTEFWLVVGTAFALFIASSAASLLFSKRRHISDGYAFALAVFELFVLFFIVLLGRIRGWSLRSLGLHPTWRLTGAGVLLYFFTLVLVGVIYRIASAAIGSIPSPNLDANGLTCLGILVVSAVNPLFEETLVTGYIIRAMRSEGAALAITVSSLLRFLYHTYQGPIAAVSILPVGVLFAAVFWGYRELWPLVVAHALMDLTALWQLAAAR